jgi:hypothetical protein
MELLEEKKLLKIDMWGLVFFSILTSIVMTCIFSFYVVTEIQALEFLRLFVVVISLHLPLLISYYLRWRFFHFVSITGWLITWIGYIYYLFAENEGMKDLVIIAWVTVVWIVTNSIAIILQSVISYKKRRKEAGTKPPSDMKKPVKFYDK